MARLVPAQMRVQGKIGPVPLVLIPLRDATVFLRGPHSCLVYPSGLPLTLCYGGAFPRRVDRALRIRLAIKRGADLVLASLALVMLAPALLLIALAIRLTSPGPALFRQVREGLGGKPFRIYKFRTMQADRCDPFGLCPAVPDDPRITPLGRFLRRTSLDELPQLINVLRNEMSLIGPRPHVYSMTVCGICYTCLAPYYAARHAMKPGITGWAQANGYRGPLDDLLHARARIDHDLAYIENFSLLLDLRILWLTLRHSLSGGSPCSA